VDRETQLFNIDKEVRLKELGVPRPTSQPETTIGEPKPPESTKMPLDRDHDDNGEVIQVDEEDTVLY
jgi:hypothetical protein